MKLFKIVLLCSATTLSCSAFSQSVDLQVLKKSLNPWQPIEIIDNKNISKIVLPTTTVTSDAYEALISSGICTPVWVKSAPEGYLKNTKEIHVVNKFSAQGYTFENPLITCKKMGALMDDEAKTLMYENTHGYVSK
ncbi:hypothetical protein OW793_19095 [Klebsiella pneumoniae]|uniref:hypothetical protein n=1 Tax=Klebsiella pneumoniae TaxID=573 RepID=UPI000B407CB2|nr:hypothetical protein [Klebsiella pneumoniae]EKV9747450.1 hypothetical protein [Klebsiella pneumoniae]EKW0376601.1 hypothetical protein [Klebsiella pneumoniae]EKY0200186.1 hypothetical protein [Klebsiella pneumoniae]ELH1568051.1 hypothetical protein [Klebsiella pneumoniae]OVW81376.1 hypothetical protein BME46_16425 [Klebsiella pneumoniae]